MWNCSSSVSLQSRWSLTWEGHASSSESSPTTWEGTTRSTTTTTNSGCSCLLSIIRWFSHEANRFDERGTASGVPAAWLLLPEPPRGGNGSREHNGRDGYIPSSGQDSALLMAIPSQCEVERVLVGEKAGDWRDWAEA